MERNFPVNYRKFTTIFFSVCAFHAIHTMRSALRCAEQRASPHPASTLPESTSVQSGQVRGVSVSGYSATLDMISDQYHLRCPRDAGGCQVKSIASRSTVPPTRPTPRIKGCVWDGWSADDRLDFGSLPGSNRPDSSRRRQDHPADSSQPL